MNRTESANSGKKKKKCSGKSKKKFSRWKKRGWVGNCKQIKFYFRPCVKTVMPEVERQLSINITHSSSSDFVFNFTDVRKSFLSSTDFPKKRKHQNVYKIFFACPQITFNLNSTPYIETIELPFFAHGVGGKLNT